ncbi:MULTISPECIES: sigma-54 dependent transcriptional regulator [unclassified Xanthomonas]|uniref:sigma 54-interacting transcriptional regulator n=1 Tax=unclassified Xanthomonas TaxID=2643310 RepID=UPI0018617C29|nr:MULTISPECIES: sigma-54 dependent transcriptional regulator [unclassified Xanthomonas]QNH14589.1 sigma-54-dependent Fis family transcriptional regulator [Xanthomonas sp. SI]QNH18821.1 sigma-54-dependent Fis family transcriptional regulator [Xanthomonas sp. SS]
MNWMSAAAPPGPSRCANPMIGESAALCAARRLLQRYAQCNAPVLIEGETGTGKELAAREIHYASARHLGPFVPINCGGLTDSLLESELFGHRRGAFTDAHSSEPGLVDCARGGTLFLDEIDSLSAKAQTTLLRFLQNGEFRAVGERTLRAADVRIVAATNASLATAVETRLFRRDLLYRLNPLYVLLPPLRDREGDVMLLARYLLAQAPARFGTPPRQWAQDVLLALCDHDWPGNVRELDNIVLRLSMRVERERIGMDDLALAEPAIWGETMPPRTTFHGKGDDDEGHARPPLCFARAKQHAIARFERCYLTALMRDAEGNVSRAALLSGTERRQLGKLLKRHGVERGHAVPE